LNNQERSVLV